MTGSPCRRSTTRSRRRPRSRPRSTRPGTVLVSGRLLAEIASRLPNAPVQFSTEDGKIVVSCGSARFTLLSMPVEEYPTLPQVAERSPGVLPAEDFADRRRPGRRRRIPRRCHPGDHRRAARGRREQPRRSSPPTATGSRCARSTGMPATAIGRGIDRAGSGAHPAEIGKTFGHSGTDRGVDHEHATTASSSPSAPTRRPSPRC